MNEDPAPKPAPSRKPIIVPAGSRQRSPLRPPAAARVIPAPGAAAPAPGSIVRSLVATRGWANINAFAFIIFGVLGTAGVGKRWLKANEAVRQLEIEDTTAVILAKADMIFSAAFAAGCLYAALKLFRYSASISRLRQAERMHELENALRHQRTVWIVLGTLGAMWLLLFASQLFYFFTSWNAIRTEEEDIGGRARAEWHTDGE
ncbi:MAG TPA: hypothetical protein VG796_12040 [Verrucomicrobiales bacterium]|nr:hypothetical protein [Verrucomicrobiales bacterium]